MTEFIAALSDPNFPFIRYALITGLLASIPFGIIGTYVVVRRISYIAGAISHCILGGIGAGLYLQKETGIDWFGPLHGAIVVALLAAVILALVSLFAKQREDSVIGALWAAGMATGLLFLARTSGYNDPMSYLFGNILLLSDADMWLVLALDIVVIGLVMVFYNYFLAICFDEEFAGLRGVNTHLLYLLLLCLTALTIVLLVRIVGIVMVIALLTLPAAIAGNFVRGIKQMMITSTLLCGLFITSGLAASYTMDLPSGPVIILFAALVYLVVVLLKKVPLFSK
ncbi:MAG: metal ABC transporter permease [Desulfopila sp.]